MAGSSSHTKGALSALKYVASATADTSAMGTIGGSRARFGRCRPGLAIRKSVVQAFRPAGKRTCAVNYLRELSYKTGLVDTFSPDNRLFVLARQGRRPPTALVAIAVAFVVTMVGVLPGQIPGRIILFTPGGVPRFSAELQPVIWPIVMNVSTFLTMMVGIGLWVRFASKRPFRTLGWERSSDVLPRATRGMGISVVMVAIVCGLSIAGGASFSPGLTEKIGVAAAGIRFLSLLSY